ncbi:MAG: Holliday junction branch migration protein RuvA [Gammaproteobacteria bacterium]
MIGFLRGQLAAKYAADILIDVGGVGYEVSVPMSTYYDLPPVGKDVALFTHLSVSETLQALYGFATEEERALFRALIKVSGVGAKLAITILSGISVEDFVHSVHGKDTARLVKLPGIGKKTAERLVVEMGDKLDKRDAPVSVAPGIGTGSARSEAVSALLALGYRSAEVSRLLDKIDTKDRTAEQMIRDALKLSGA